MMQKIKKEQLAKNLNAILHSEVGMQGLNTLLCGWKKHRKFGNKYCHALNSRDWLFVTEVADLSAYAGYDLTQKSAG